MNTGNHFTFDKVDLQHNKSVLKSREDADISVDVRNKKLASPVILSNMKTCQNEDVLDLFDELKLPYVYYRTGGHDDILKFVRQINMEDWYLKSISVGVQEEDYNLLLKIKGEGLKLDWLTIDVALIWNTNYESYIRKVRNLFPEVYLIAGNFSNPLTVRWLHDLGVNAAKFGIGVSKLCRTKQFTGFGSSLVDFIECNNEKRHYPIDLIFDGGISVLDEENGEMAFGDIFKALNFGAKFVMSSSLFRWARELANEDGEVIQFGNSTALAKGHNNHVEGAVKTFRAKYRLRDRLKEIDDNLRSSVSYAGIRRVKDAEGSCRYKIITS